MNGAAASAIPDREQIELVPEDAAFEIEGKYDDDGVSITYVVVVVWFEEINPWDNASSAAMPLLKGW